MTQGNRLSCRDQEGRRGSEEAVPGPSVFPSGEPGVSGDFWVGMQPWALSLPDKELCLREALAVCTPPAPEPSAPTALSSPSLFLPYSCFPAGSETHQAHYLAPQALVLLCLPPSLQSSHFPLAGLWLISHPLLP